MSNELQQALYRNMMMSAGSGLIGGARKKTAPKPKPKPKAKAKPKPKIDTALKKVLMAEKKELKKKITAQNKLLKKYDKLTSKGTKSVKRTMCFV